MPTQYSNPWLPLIIKCHVTPPSPAVMTITVDDVATEYTVQPTINWVPSSSDDGATKIRVNLAYEKFFNYESDITTFNFKINVKDSNVLICKYDGFWPRTGDIRWGFDIVSQPVWNDPNWQPYDITGHGPDLDLAGPGSLQILDGQTVEFVGQLKRSAKI